MIQNYLNFNVAKFVSDCYEHKSILPALQEQLDEIDGIKAIDPSRDKVQTSPTNDGLINTMLLRANLAERIADYQRDINLFERACQTLTEDEREAIDICFNGRNIARQCRERHIEERTLYHRRKRALNKLSKAIAG